jgi:sugar phosphate isomerase/epimerase
MSVPLFAFDNGVGRGKWSPDQQARVLAELGYGGIAYSGTQNIPQMLAALDRHDLRMVSTYVGVRLGGQQPSYDAGLPEAIGQLKGRETIIWLYVQGGQPSSTALDDQAVRVIRQIATMAQASGLRVALYPHVGFYVATVQDALRLVKKVDRENVGASLNLCHFLKLDDQDNLSSRLEEALPHLLIFSINGADGGDTRAMGWDRLIQTLDRGDFDVYRLVSDLRQRGYRGPIGLQCYAIAGDVRENLTRSIEAWKAIVARLPHGAQ